MGKGIGGKIQAPWTLDKVSSLLELEPESLNSQISILYAPPHCTIHILHLSWDTKQKDMHTYLLNI